MKGVQVYVRPHPTKTRGINCSNSQILSASVIGEMTVVDSVQLTGVLYSSEFFFFFFYNPTPESVFAATKLKMTLVRLIVTL